MLRRPAVVPPPMSEAAVNEALNLIDQAWRTRYRTFQQPPATEAELQRIIRGVRADLTKAVEICRRVDAKRELSIALGKLGHVEQNDVAKLACYEEAVAAARGCGDPMRLAHAVRHMGDVHRAAKRLPDAGTCYQEALTLYRAADSPPILDFANAVRPMAILKVQLGDDQAARALWQEAKDLYAAVGIEAGVTEADRWIKRLNKA